MVRNIFVYQFKLDAFVKKLTKQNIQHFIHNDLHVVSGVQLTKSSLIIIGLKQTPVYHWSFYDPSINQDLAFDWQTFLRTDWKMEKI